MEGKKTLWIVIGVLGGLFIVITIVVVLFVKHRCFGERFETVDGSLVMFRYRVLRNATNNFSEKLGEGGFGSVFKGTLQGSTAIAVKRLNCPKQVDKQFLAEVRTIGKIQHINLVRLCGFCAEASKRFLIYEYMPNGSLESVLFKNSSIVLDWKARYDIAIGTARGLAYLHEECRECIIHCDIKPENILLDAEYVPKIADFGLAKLIHRDISRIITTMKGTRGYIAPEWISGEAITAKADVFSYGMLLFEVVSGRRNRDRSSHMIVLDKPDGKRWKEVLESSIDGLSAELNGFSPSGQLPHEKYADKVVSASNPGTVPQDRSKC